MAIRENYPCVKPDPPMSNRKVLSLSGCPKSARVLKVRGGRGLTESECQHDPFDRIIACKHLPRGTERPCQRVSAVNMWLCLYS